MCMIEPDLPPTTNKTIVLDGNLLKLHVEVNMMCKIFYFFSVFIFNIFFIYSDCYCVCEGLQRDHWILLVPVSCGVGR